MLLRFFCMVMTLCFFVTSCNRLPEEVVRALDKAGANRAQMERVLAHYRHSDSQKYKAACFLIANMPYHRSKQQVNLPPGYQTFARRTDSLYRAWFGHLDINTAVGYKLKGRDYDSLRSIHAAYFNGFPSADRTENSRSDITLLDAKFLIDHIDQSFDIWQTSPFLKDMDFGTFKEFVLPYRSTNEEMAFSRKELRTFWQGVVRKDGDSQLDSALLRYKVWVDKSRWINHFTKPRAKSALYDVLLPKFKMDCHDMTNWSIQVLRACGIPAVYEYTLQWKDRASRHFWCVSPDESGIWKPYTAPDNILCEDWESDIRYAGKVYRRQFAANPNTPYFLANPDEYIPEELSSPLLSDQTYRYHQTVTIHLPMHGPVPNKVVYLCMLQGSELNPVGWGTVDHRKEVARFEQVPLFTVFIPAYMDDNEELTPFGVPFVLEDDVVPADIPLPLTQNSPSGEKVLELQGGELVERTFWGTRQTSLRCTQFQPSEKSYGTVELHRKYPEKRRLAAMREKLKGSFFTGSQHEKKGFDTLAVLSSAPKPYLQEIQLHNRKAYRYYRFFTPDKGPVNIAHMEFLGTEKSSTAVSDPTPLPILSADTSPQHAQEKLVRIEGTPIPTGSNPHYAFDGLPDTYVGASGIGMDFGRPVTVTHIRFVPRTANNGIVPGNVYRFYYHDGRKWRVHSTQTADNHYLHVAHVPEGTLYRLENMTEGKEDQVFLLTNGRQQFINLHNPLYK